jgi:hypothetical protein
MQLIESVRIGGKGAAHRGWLMSRDEEKESCREKEQE